MATTSDWSGALGATWAARAEVMERLLGPFGDAAMTALGPITEQTVLDLGCGGGATTLELAKRAGTKGTVLGVDVSPDLIALAGERRQAATGPASHAGFLRADAATTPLPGPFDALYSQFGAMFFDEQVPAFANLHGAMKSGGRLSIACWQTPKKNGWAMLALNAAKPLLPPVPLAIPGAPGPFAWADPASSFMPVLAAAGWLDVAFEPLETILPLGAGISDDPLEAAVEFSMNIGPLASRLESADKVPRDQVEDRVRDVLDAQPRTDCGHIGVPAAGWIVTARA